MVTKGVIIDLCPQIKQKEVPHLEKCTPQISNFE
jgi:hypothetical protein